MKTLFKTIAAIATFAIASVAMAASWGTHFDVLHATDKDFDNASWVKTVRVNSNEVISFDIFYHMINGQGTNIITKLDNIANKTFQKGDSVTVNAFTDGDGLSKRYGSVRLIFEDTVEMRFRGTSDQRNTCASLLCGKDVSGSAVLGSGYNVGTIPDGEWGNVIASFKAIPVAVTPKNNCSINGITVNHGASRTFYSSTQTSGSCSSIDQVRSCNNGVLSGSNTYKYASCSTVNSSNPSVETKGYNNVDEDSATVNGYVQVNNRNNDVDFWIEYGTDRDLDAYDKSRTKNVDSNDTIDVRLNGLKSYTRYYYRAVIKGDDGKVRRGSIKSFRTDKGQSQNKVEAETKSAKNIDKDEARLRGYADINNADNARVWFRYGTSASNLSKTTAKKYIRNSGSFEREVNGLRSCTTYYYQFVVKDEDSNDTDYGSTRSFKTDGNCSNNNGDSGATAGTATGIASNISTRAAQLNGYVVGKGSATCYFQYGRTRSLGLASPAVSINLNNTSSCSSYRTGLASNSTYYYRSVLVKDGIRYYGNTKSFRTNRVVATTPTRPSTPSRPVRPVNTNTTVTIVNKTEKVTTRGDLELTKWVSAENDPRFDQDTDARRGEKVYYKVKVKNTTGSDLDDVVVIDRIPYYLELDESSNLDDDDDKQIRWVVDLDAGESRTFVTELRVREDTDRGQIITSYASAENGSFSVNSNDVEIEVISGSLAMDNDDQDANQSANIFGSGFFPTTLTGWGILLAIALAIAYFISRIMVSRNENAKVLAELHAAAARRNA